MFFKDKISKIQQASSKKAAEEELEEDHYYYYDPKDYADTGKKVSKKETFLLVLSAYITFAPVFIVLLLILALVY